MTLFSTYMCLAEIDYTHFDGCLIIVMWSGDRIYTLTKARVVKCMCSCIYKQQAFEC